MLRLYRSVIVARQQTLRENRMQMDIRHLQDKSNNDFMPANAGITDRLSASIHLVHEQFETEPQLEKPRSKT